MEELLKLKWTPIFIPFIVGILNYHKLDKGLKYLFYFVIYGTLNEITYYVLIKLGSHNTLYLVHLYNLVAFVLLGLFYSEVLKGLIPKRIIQLLIVFFVLYSILNALFLQSILKFPSVPSSIFRIVFLLASILFFYKTMVEAKISNLWNEPLVWINSAVLLYYSVSLFFSILFNLVLNYSREFSKLMGWYFAIANALFYVLIAIAFIKTRNKK